LRRLDARQALPACEVSLAQQVAVKGLNPAWESSHPLSSAVIPSMGLATVDMASALDATVGNYMNLNGLPGGAVAITYKNRLIFAKSYGYVDVDNALFAEPDSRFRVASVSKAITAMGILKLVHDGQLSLADRPFPFSGTGTVIGGTYNIALSPPSGPTVDEMLHHAGGWDRDIGPDLMGYDTLHTVKGLIPNSSAPPDCTNLLRYVESQKICPSGFGAVLSPPLKTAAKPYPSAVAATTDTDRCADTIELGGHLVVYEIGPLPEA
jgi:hypothetical protein